MFKISFLIKLAFECGLSFDSFRKLAYLAGHSFHGKTCYPPYFFLQCALYKGSRYEEYKNALLDINVIKTLLKNDILRLNNCENFYFSARLISDYLRKNKEKYKTSLMRALEDRNFQTDFIRYFFEAVYINGNLDYGILSA